MESSREDIFENLDSEKRALVAYTLNKHLRWRSKDDVEDNFVSWTSSLLFALQYIYYRHKSRKDGSSLQHIKLFVIDTTLFPSRVFLRDLVLLDVFYKFDDRSGCENLKNLRSLRTEVKRQGLFYFGEYLTQGALRIEDKHQVISAASLMRGDLMQRLQPLFPAIHDQANREPSWANEVLRLRDAIFSRTETPDKLSTGEAKHRLKSIREIADLFQPGWKFPLAVYFAALVGPRWEGLGSIALSDFILSEPFYTEIQSLELADFCPSALDGIPELTQVKKLLNEIYMEFLAREAGKFLGEARVLIRHLHPRHVSHLQIAFPIDGPNANMYSLVMRTLSARFEALRLACAEVVSAYSDPEEE
ncbi:hypothetical protein BDW74DRAFT_181126 [Aspergillus multicolor]|uniref:uncharacterized protein n=1 Tax=Aspergillus multicolor TaxID=41759 RepID=UPI003CCE144A